MAYTEKRGKGEFPWRVRWLLPEKGPKGEDKYDSESGFASRQDALDYGHDQEAAIRAGTWINPARGAMSLAEFRAQWLPAQDLAPDTVIGYDYAWTGHIEPRWGSKSLREIMDLSLEMQAWLKQLDAKYSPGHTGKITSQLRGMFDAAVYLQYIGRSPMPPKRKRKARSARLQQAANPVRKGVVIAPDDVAAILHRMPTFSDVLLIITDLFTGQRWSEVSGMTRSGYHLTPPDPAAEREAAGHYVIDPLTGASHRDKAGARYAGPPKSGDMARLERGYEPGRLLDFAPFLVELHVAFLAALPAEQEIVFANTRGDYWDSSYWNESRWRPACDGRAAAYSPRGVLLREAWEPVHAGLIRHDMKHTHKAMLNDKRVHKVMADYRLGHVDDKTPGTYDHPTVQMRRECVAAMQETWAQWDVDLGYWGVKRTPAGVDLSGLTIPLTVGPRRFPKTSPS